MKMVPPISSFSCKSNSFSYERFCARPRFETEAQRHLESACSGTAGSLVLDRCFCPMGALVASQNLHVWSEMKF